LRMILISIFGDNIMSVQNEAVHSINALNNWLSPVGHI